MMFRNVIYRILVSALLGTGSTQAMQDDETLVKSRAVPQKLLTEEDIKGKPFYTFFEGKDKQEALQILATKYRTLMQWFGCQRNPSERIAFEGSLRNSAMDLMFAYEGFENGPFWIDYKQKIEKAREKYKALKKATCTRLPWPGHVYIASLRATLLKCKAKKYILLADLPNVTPETKCTYALTAVLFNLLAMEEEKKIVYKPSPPLGRKASAKEEAPPPVPPRDHLDEFDEIVGNIYSNPPELLQTQNPLLGSGEYDPPSALTEMPPVRKRVPRARIHNIPRSEPLKDVRKFVTSCDPLTIEQKMEIKKLTDDGVSYEHAYKAIVGGHDSFVITL